MESQSSVQPRIWVPQISHESYVLHIPHLASTNLWNFHSVVLVLFSVRLYPVSFRTSLQPSQVKAVTVYHGHFLWNANSFTIHDHLAITIDAVSGNLRGWSDKVKESVNQTSCYRVNILKYGGRSVRLTTHRHITCNQERCRIASNWACASIVSAHGSLSSGNVLEHGLWSMPSITGLLMVQHAVPDTN